MIRQAVKKICNVEDAGARLVAESLVILADKR